MAYTCSRANQGLIQHFLIQKNINQQNVEANECLEVLTNFIDKEILQNQVQLNDIIWPEQNLNGQNDNYESFANSTDSGFEPTRHPSSPRKKCQFGKRPANTVTRPWPRRCRPRHRSRCISSSRCCLSSKSCSKCIIFASRPSDNSICSSELVFNVLEFTARYARCMQTTVSCLRCRSRSVAAAGMYPTTYLSARDEGGKLRRLNPLSITYTRPLRSRRNNPTVKVMRELPRKNLDETKQIGRFNEVSNSGQNSYTKSSRFSSFVNIVSEFNVENVTEFGTEKSQKEDAQQMEVDEEKSDSKTPIDFNLYRQFWALQDFFRNPNQCYNKMYWKVFSAAMTTGS
ncbi:unnamed protein product [Trichogramma brassicae]|uniref:Uncharacterized protein n=1 Tax=Trichogramma brassicae TaxID=86971 RepID=A0A6H5JAQ1_9HYME|nr:unnamed protein product [Trichogramma brassicae]